MLLEFKCTAHGGIAYYPARNFPLCRYRNVEITTIPINKGKRVLSSPGNNVPATSVGLPKA